MEIKLRNCVFFVCFFIVDVTAIKLQPVDDPTFINFNMDYYKDKPQQQQQEESDKFDGSKSGDLEFDSTEVSTDDTVLQEKFEDTTDDFVHAPENEEESTDKPQPLDSWSVVWYIASFGGLIAFFLVVSCSEWCCRRNIRHSSTNCASQTTNTTSTAITIPDTPPPSYEHFAPPSYESVMKPSKEKSEYDVYVVPVHSVHTLRTIFENDEREDTPPSYYTASQGLKVNSQHSQASQERTQVTDASNLGRELPLVDHCQVNVSNIPT